MAKIFFSKTFLFTAYTLLFMMSLYAQKKDFTAEQLLKNKMPLVVLPLPVVISWNDDDYLLLSRKVHPDSIAKQFLFDPKTGKEIQLKKTEITIKNKY